eukprot:scaffold190232_cov18-Tisochrysis_lutea.AAC.1
MASSKDGDKGNERQGVCPQKRSGMLAVGVMLAKSHSMVRLAAANQRTKATPAATTPTSGIMQFLQPLRCKHVGSATCQARKLL